MPDDSLPKDMQLGRLTGILDMIQNMHADAWKVLQEEGPQSDKLRRMEAESEAYVHAHAEYLAQHGLIPSRNSRGGDGAYCGFSLMVINIAAFSKLLQGFPDNYFPTHGGKEHPLHGALSTMRYQHLTEVYSHDGRKIISDSAARSEHDQVMGACRQFRRAGLNEEDISAIEDRVRYWADNLADEHDLATWCAGTVNDLLAMKDRLLFERALQHALESLPWMIECEEGEDGDPVAAKDMRKQLQDLQELQSRRGF